MEQWIRENRKRFRLVLVGAAWLLYVILFLLVLHAFDLPEKRVQLSCLIVALLIETVFLTRWLLHRM